MQLMSYFSSFKKTFEVFHTTQMAPVRAAEITMPKQPSSGASGNIRSDRKCVKRFSLCIIFPTQPQRDLSDKKKTDHPFFGLTCEPSWNSTIPAQPTWQIQHEFGRKVCESQLHFPASGIHQLFCHCDSARIPSQSTLLQKDKWVFWDMI